MTLSPRPSSQRGVALAVGLIFLVILTVIGLAAIRVTSSQTLQANNYQFKTLTFQAAESGIRRVMAEIRGEIPGPAGADNILVTAINATALSGVPTRTVDVVPPNLSAGSMTVSATLTSDNPDGNGPPLENFSIGKDSSVYRFTIRSNSTLNNTGAVSDHQQGVARVAPKS